ncbi:Junctophilin-3, partial [Fragariocoptes setiger]
MDSISTYYITRNSYDHRISISQLNSSYIIVVVVAAVKVVLYMRACVNINKRVNTKVDNGHNIFLQEYYKFQGNIYLLYTHNDLIDLLHLHLLTKQKQIFSHETTLRLLNLKSFVSDQQKQQRQQSKIPQAHFVVCNLRTDTEAHKLRALETLSRANFTYLPSSFSITASPSGGRFDFDDGGAYCGGWQDGKAHGHGVCTGTKGLGEYSGSWHFGFEVCGVYKWPSGGVYEGRWQNGKRHGVGVEYMGKWIYKGEWTQGFKGRYGVRSSSVSAVKYEGTWAVGYQDGYGWETYADGGSYQGQWFKGMRHNYGVRSSAPYGDCSHQSGNQIQLGSTKVQSNSMQSSSFEIDDDLLASDELRPTSDRLMTSKNGFVLVAKPLDPLPAIAGRDNSDKSRRNSLIDKALGHSTSSTHSTASIFRGLRFKKQRSTSDLDAATTREASGVGQHHLDARNQHSNAGDPPDQYGESASSSAAVFALSPEELDITDPTTVETYMGEWNLDKRCGYGVCERSDKLKYEGQWSNDMKNGYGVTTHKNGIKEEGKYKNNVLIIDAKVKRYFKLRSTNLRQKIDDAVRLANQAQEVALKKADIAITRAATSRDKAEQATEAAAEAIKESRIAYSVAKQYSDPRMPFGYPMSGGGMPGNNYGAPMAYGSTFETPLKRRMSYFGHHHGGPGAKGAGSMHYSGGPHEYCGGYNENELPPDQHSQTETDPHSSRQFLRAPTAPMKPFGGRRGSFRYPGSEQAGGLSQSLASQPNINQGRHHLSSSS